MIPGCSGRKVLTFSLHLPAQAEATIVTTGEYFLCRYSSRDKRVRVLNYNNKGTSITGQITGAGYAITGTAISNPAGVNLFGAQMKSIHAKLTAQMVQGGTGRLQKLHGLSCGSFLPYSSSPGLTGGFEKAGW